MTTSEYFIEFVLRSAELKGWTQSELAKQVGTSRQHVHWWKTGRNRVSMEMAQKCLDALDSTWQEFGRYLQLRKKKGKA